MLKSQPQIARRREQGGPVETEYDVGIGGEALWRRGKRILFPEGAVIISESSVMLYCRLPVLVGKPSSQQAVAHSLSRGKLSQGQKADTRGARS